MHIMHQTATQLITPHTHQQNAICHYVIQMMLSMLKIKDGTYGYCEETGEAIGLKRLIARPIATLTIEAQEKHERHEKIFIDD